MESKTNSWDFSKMEIHFSKISQHCNCRKSKVTIPKGYFRVSGGLVKLTNHQWNGRSGFSRVSAPILIGELHHPLAYMEASPKTNTFLQINIYIFLLEKYSSIYENLV